MGITRPFLGSQAYQFDVARSLDVPMGIKVESVWEPQKFGPSRVDLSQLV